MPADSRRLGVAANRIDSASNPVIPQEQRRDQEDDASDPHRHRDTKETGRAEIDKFVGNVVDGAPIDDTHLNASQQDEHPQRKDEGIEA